MKKKELRSFIDQLIIDRDCTSDTDKRWRDFLVRNKRRDQLQWEIDYQESKRHGYDQIISNLIQCYHEL